MNKQFGLGLRTAIVRTARALTVGVLAAVGMACLDYHYTGSCTTSTPPGTLTCSFTHNGLQVLCSPQPAKYRIVPGPIHGCTTAAPGVHGYTECENDVTYPLLYTYECDPAGGCVPKQVGDPVPQTDVPCATKVPGGYPCP